MDTVRVTGSSPGFFLGSDIPSDPAATQAGIARLSSWMMILGTVRLVCVLADYAGSYLELSRGTPSWRLAGRFLQENPPAVVIGFAWPLALGIILQRTGRPMFLKAAAVTFLILSAAGVTAMIAGVFLKSEWQVYFGSFHVTRGMLNSLRPTTVVKLVLGTIQLLLELGIAAWAWWLLRQTRGRHGAEVLGSHASKRTLLQGRLALYFSLGFLVLNVRLPFWSAYLELLNRSRFVREFVLENDASRHVSYRAMIADSPEGRRVQELDMLLTSAIRHATNRRPDEAKKEYLQVISKLRSNDFQTATSSWRDGQLARASNNLAWMLVTCDDAAFRDARQGLSLARDAVDLAPDEGTYWNTLAVANYRAGELDKALKAFDRSMELRSRGDSYDWYFLAMVHAKRGDKDEARKWFDMAVAWNEERNPGEEELHRFRVEAAENLGLPEQPPLSHVPRRRDLFEPKSIPHPLRERGKTKGLEIRKFAPARDSIQ